MGEKALAQATTRKRGREFLGHLPPPPPQGQGDDHHGRGRRGGGASCQALMRTNQRHPLTHTACLAPACTAEPGPQGEPCRCREKCFLSWGPQTG